VIRVVEADAIELADRADTRADAMRADHFRKSCSVELEQLREDSEERAAPATSDITPERSRSFPALISNAGRSEPYVLLQTQLRV
jgi:hypothetical protein